MRRDLGVLTCDLPLGLMIYKHLGLWSTYFWDVLVAAKWSTLRQNQLKQLGWFWLLIYHFIEPFLAYDITHPAHSAEVWVISLKWNIIFELWAYDLPHFHSCGKQGMPPGGVFATSRDIAEKCPCGCCEPALNNGFSTSNLMEIGASVGLGTTYLQPGCRCSAGWRHLHWHSRFRHRGDSHHTGESSSQELFLEIGVWCLVCKPCNGFCNIEHNHLSYSNDILFVLCCVDALWRRGPQESWRHKWSTTKTAIEF